MAEEPVFRSTEGPEQDIYGEMTDLANAILRAPKEWTVLWDDLLALKRKAIQIGLLIEHSKKAGL